MEHQDAPGAYEVVRWSIVKGGCGTDSGKVSELQVGDRIQVLEVVPLPAAQRLRARIAEPAGWISLKNTNNGQRWANPEPSIATASLAGAPGGGLALGATFPSDDDSKFALDDDMQPSRTLGGVQTLQPSPTLGCLQTFDGFEGGPPSLHMPPPGMPPPQMTTTTISEEQTVERQGTLATFALRTFDVNDGFDKATQAGSFKIPKAARDSPAYVVPVSSGYPAGPPCGGPPARAAASAGGPPGIMAPPGAAFSQAFAASATAAPPMPALPPGQLTVTPAPTAFKGPRPPASTRFASPTTGDDQADAEPARRSRWPQRATPAAAAPDDSLRTTLTLRNLPRRFTRAMLIELLDAQGYSGNYDFVYLPTDFKRLVAYGYAFLNMISNSAAEQAMAKLPGYDKWPIPSQKVLDVCWSEMQGLETHIERYRDSPVMHERVPDQYKAALFRDGQRLDFPEPTKRIRPPHTWRHAADAGVAGKAAPGGAEECVDDKGSGEPSGEEDAADAVEVVESASKEAELVK